MTRLPCVKDGPIVGGKSGGFPYPNVSRLPHFSVRRRPVGPRDLIGGGVLHEVPGSTGKGRRGGYFYGGLTLRKSTLV